MKSNQCQSSNGFEILMKISVMNNGNGGNERLSSSSMKRTAQPKSSEMGWLALSWLASVNNENSAHIMKVKAGLIQLKWLLTAQNRKLAWQMAAGDSCRRK
jgi:hypothetical protein